MAGPIDVSKGSNVPGIRTSICKDIMTLLPLEITFLFYCSIQTGIFPKDWAKGTITVILKNGQPSDPLNWPSITQTPIFAKVLEKLIHKRLLAYFDDNEILTSYQYGFQPHQSTQEAVFDLTKFIYTGLNNKKLIAAVCLDVCKAFDCINHELLICKMRKIGFNENILLWFKSYLTRTQTVNFKDLYSDTLLGSIGNLKLNMYADDCVLFTTGKNWDRMITKVQFDLKSIIGVREIGLK